MNDESAGMMKTISDFDPDTSVLFLGSGFSLGATNINGRNPPNGAALRQHFLEALNYPPTNTYNIQILAEEFAEQDSQKLADELYSIFRMESISSTQSIILNEPWARIYTTNYDDIVEVFRHQKKIVPDTYDVSEKIPNKLPHGAIIHLHGSIRLIKPDNVNDNLVLSETSYVNQYLTQSSWSQQFQKDIAFASALYIVGYSLSDYHIAALLLANPDLVERTFFISDKQQDEIFLRRTKKYGRTLFIGVDGFAHNLKKVRRIQSKTDLSTLKAFRLMYPDISRKTSAKPTASEIYDLLVYGNFNPARLARSPADAYVIGRNERVHSAMQLLDNSRALVIHGMLGNGKTIFLHLLAYELTKNGWTCVKFRPGYPDIVKEIPTLKSVGRLVIFFDEYLASQDSLQGILAALPETKIVVEIRTSIFEVRYHEISRVLPEKFDSTSINFFSENETTSFITFCKHAGVPPLDSQKPKDMRDILLELFKNKYIQDRTESFLRPLFENPQARRVVSVILMTSEYQSSIDPSFLRAVVSVDPFLCLKQFEALANEIVTMSADGFRVRSSIFASFLIQQFIEPEELVESAVKLIRAAVQRQSQRIYRVLMGNVMAFSSLHRILQHNKNATDIIIGIYEKLRVYEDVVREPLFWLQYAIAMTEISKIDAAQEFIKTAYRVAQERPTFRTFQIDTQAFRIALLAARQQSAGRPVSNIADIIGGLERINNMLGKESHRSYAARVLEEVPLFIAVRRKDLLASEADTVKLWIDQIAAKLSELPDMFKAVVEVDDIRKRLIDSTASLSRG